MHENPFPNHQGTHTNIEQTLLFATRRNLLNVFKQLSKVKDKYRRDNPINALDIRPGLSSNRQSTIDIKDSSSLLFYYIFDDWYTTYALVAKEEHQYGHQLEQLVPILIPVSKGLRSPFTSAETCLRNPK